MPWHNRNESPDAGQSPWDAKKLIDVCRRILPRKSRSLRNETVRGTDYRGIS
jgi:hypothetical protein